MAHEIYSRNWDRMSFEEQREYRDRKLSYFVRTQLYPYSPFYRKMFNDAALAPEDIRGVDDLRKLPFTRKSDIAPSADEHDRYERFVLKPLTRAAEERMPRLQFLKTRFDSLFKGDEFVLSARLFEYAPVHVQFTAGQTGRPTPVMFTRSDVERMAEAGRRILELAGFGVEIERKDAVILNAMPFASHLWFQMIARGMERAGILSLYTGGESSAIAARRISDTARSVKVTGIIGMPGNVFEVLRSAIEEEIDLSSLRLVILGGERISKDIKEDMHEFLRKTGARDAFVVGAFGFTEGRKGYSECASGADAGYHIYPDMDYLEIIDPETEAPVAEGEDGELVYTCLDGRGTCVLRFRTGDYVKGGIVYEPCPSCGRTVPRLGSDISRFE
ncbi:MAG: hypothetical protein CVT63_03520 [Candidatus Anoxymicrobium japonicum]|uniref:AMP-dependent synthetase/ligase domain-containing protein n=1 Tax=Candidatus Anoxymicrobium japonicum TaxID=2013648 RepID=A0A2N3G6H5_9ACTN|nr:MAG: hypothetical protein CVT63_03520 [Candidatus Anoxymicrobium japonicum]